MSAAQQHNTEWWMLTADSYLPAALQVSVSSMRRASVDVRLPHEAYRGGGYKHHPMCLEGEDALLVPLRSKFLLDTSAAILRETPYVFGDNTKTQVSRTGVCRFATGGSCHNVVPHHGGSSTD